MNISCYWQFSARPIAWIWMGISVCARENLFVNRCTSTFRTATMITTNRRCYEPCFSHLFCLHADFYNIVQNKRLRKRLIHTLTPMSNERFSRSLSLRFNNWKLSLTGRGRLFANKHMRTTKKTLWQTSHATLIY